MRCGHLSHDRVLYIEVTCPRGKLKKMKKLELSNLEQRVSGHRGASRELHRGAYADPMQGLQMPNVLGKPVVHAPPQLPQDVGAAD